MSTIAVDAMGGDHGIESTLPACARLSLTAARGLRVTLVGDPEAIARGLARHPHDPERLSVVASDGVVAMDAKPREALRATPNASLPVAARLVAAGEADALVSAGNTGAVILSCAEAFERLPGVRRAALAAVYPTELTHGPRGDPFALMLDVGANLRVSAEDLVSFAVMGSAYASVITGQPEPRVALLNNGSEASKGPPEYVEAFEKLSRHRGIAFMGNIEGIDILEGRSDVVVCDGFTGNVVLKMLEGVAASVNRVARYAYRSRLRWKLALALLGGGIREIKELTDYRRYGGAPILGFDHLCLKAHGRSTPRAIGNAIKVAAKAVDGGLLERIHQSAETS